MFGALDGNCALWDATMTICLYLLLYICFIFILVSQIEHRLKHEASVFIQKRLRVVFRSHRSSSVRSRKVSAVWQAEWRTGSDCLWHMSIHLRSIHPDSKYVSSTESFYFSKLLAGKSTLANQRMCVGDCVVVMLVVTTACSCRERFLL